MLIELVNGHRLWPDCTSPEKILESVRKLSGLPNEGECTLEQMQESSWNYVTTHLMHKRTLWDKVTNPLLDVVKQCLIVDASKRPTPSELLQHPYFEEHLSKNQKNHIWVPKPYLKSSLLPDDLPTLADITGNESSNRHGTPRKRPQTNESPAELYHFWKLSGGVIPDLDDKLQTPVPVHRLPTIVRRKDVLVESTTLVRDIHKYVQ